jgi:sodium/potassium-transporting ATPase subunit alpha
MTGDVKKVAAEAPAGQKSGGGMNDAVRATEEIRQWAYQTMGAQALAQSLSTNTETGLSEAKAKEFQAQFGANALTKKVAVPWYCLFLHEMVGFFSLLLWFGSALCFIGFILQEDKEDKANLWLGIVLAAVTFITGCFSYAQTSKSAEMMAQFENFIPPVATVMRNGRFEPMDAKLIVPGDIVKVKGGENVPCDIVIFKSNEMKVNNASLTGEMMDIEVDPDLQANANIFESQNVAFFGTQCTAGEGIGICFKTGDETVIGKIANLASSAEAAPTPLSIEIERFIKIISAVAITLGVVFFIFGLVYEYPLITNLVFAIGIIVANVPEGLLATVTVSLALTAQRMASKMVLVKNLESVETLGSTSCICSDKTGTLTQNKMTVSHAFCSRQQYDCSVNWQAHERNAKREKPEDALRAEYDPQDPGFRAVVEALVYGTYTTFEYSPSEQECKQLFARLRKVRVSSLEGKDLAEADQKEMKARLVAAESRLLNTQRFCQGDASETGLVQFAQSIMDLDATRGKSPVHVFKSAAGKETEAKIPFNSEWKFNLFIRDNAPGNMSPANADENLTLYMKGAPERMIARCSKVLIGDQEVDFTDDLRKELNEANTKFGELGERVLAFARCRLDPAKFPKASYQFDVKTWKEWGKEKDRKFSDYSDREGAFPMHDLTLVGIISLNDPPRFKVDLSVNKCRSAGIKVIMVTGDQPATAAAIANKVNILKHPRREFNYLLNKEKLSRDEAWNKSTGIVIHGDLLAEEQQKTDHLEDGDPAKDQYLLDWISKPEVVFARTTPSQKLIIVDACQKSGHVVAVTGDGVNDSPAIKKADIGIAMGSGSDVAKNAADMLLLDDNFSSIVNGVEEGRLIFDNLKKSIAYTLSSNIPEILPFIMFILANVPLPLSTVLILCIDLGTDMVPAISFAYENPELDIMDRAPRKSKLDHLVNTKLISFAYLQIGVIQASAGMYTYFVILNDFGIRPQSLWFMSELQAPLPNITDEYDASKTMNVSIKDKDGAVIGYSQYGNTNMGAPREDWVRLAWDKTRMNKVDIRLFYAAERDANNFTACRWPPQDTDYPAFYRQAFVAEGHPICYSTEALKFAQSGYLCAIVCVQWADLMICKTRNLSLSQQGMVNSFGNFGLFFETCLVALLCYVPPLNIALGTRQIPFPHFICPSFSFYATIFMYDELRKIWLRNGMVREEGKLRFKGWIVQNTYY